MSDKNKKKYNYMYNKEQLRKDAEKYLKENEPPVKWTEDATIKEIIQELQVHQIELEIQNEELRNKQRQLEISRNQYSDLYENAPIVYLTLDIKGYIHKSNISGAKLFGLDSNINIKKPLAIFVTSEYKPIMYKHLKDTIEKEEKQSCEIMIINNTGKKMYVLMESIAIRNSSGYDDKEKDYKKMQIRTAIIDITERKNAEIAQKEMEEKNHNMQSFLQSSLDALPSHIAILNSNAEIIYVNKKWKKFINENNLKDLDYIPGKNYIKACSNAIKQGDSNAEKIVEAINQVLQKKSNNHYIEYPCNSTANEKWFAVRINGFKNQGEINVMISHEDITKRKKTEIKIKESEDRYKAVVEDQTELICRYKPDLTITFVNQAFCKYYNKSKEELIGNNLATQILDKYVPDEVRKKVTKKMSTLSKNNPNIVIVHSVNFDTEVRLQKSSLRAIFNDEGEIIEYQSVDRDITEQKQAEEELRKFYRAVEYSPSIVVITNNKGVIEYVNPKFCEKTGYEYEEAVGKSPQVLKSGYHNYEYYKELWNTIKSDKIWKGLFYNKRKDGKYYWDYASIAPVKDESGNITHFIKVAEDVTKKKEAEEKLKQTMKELEATNKELEQFTSVVSHDLKSPLNVVISYVNLMKKKYTDKEANYLTNQVMKRTYNMLDLIDNLLHYSRAGKVNKEDLEVCDCELILQSATENLKIDIESNNAKITHSPLPKIYGYKVQLISLFQNLLSNAIKYRKEKVAPDIYISAEKTEENNKWLFSFKDNGIGINSKKKDKIFLIFHREKTVSDKYSGYGIGLAYCKKIVENHNGKIWVESEPDKGSTFYFTINTKPIKE